MEEKEFDQHCKTVKIGTPCPTCGKDLWNVFQTFKRCECGQKVFVLEGGKHSFQEDLPENRMTSASNNSKPSAYFEAIVKKLLDDIKAGKRISPLKAIRAKCLDCTCFQLKEIEDCPAECPLKPFRFGANTTAGGMGKKAQSLASRS